jgi:hypothetical protein
MLGCYQTFLPREVVVRRFAVSLVHAMFLASCLSSGGDDVAEPANGLPSDEELQHYVLDIRDPELLSIREQVRIPGTGSSDALLFRVAGVDVTDEGVIHVLDAGARKVYTFDPNGAFLWAVGGPGQGPGEFTLRPVAIRTIGESVLVVEQRLHLWGAQGNLLRSVLLPPIGNRWPALMAVGMQGEEVLLARTRSTPHRRGDAGVHRDTIVVERGTLDDLRIDQQLPGSEWFARGSNVYFHRFFGASPQVAILDSGDIVYTAGDDYQIDGFAAGGIHRFRITAQYAKLPLSPADLDLLIASVRHDAAANSHGDGHDDDPAAFVNSVPRADHRPVIGRLVSGSDLLLIERLDLGPLFPGQPGESHWDLVQLPGNLVGRLVLPTGTAPAALNNHRLFAVVRNDDGTDDIVGYAICCLQY